MTDGRGIELVPLRAERFAAYRAHLTKEYASDKVRAGAWSPEEAQSRAEADVDGLLPGGIETKDHFLYAVRDASTAEEVGALWLAVLRQGGDRVVWIYDVEIFARYQRRGYATLALEAVEGEARKLGAERVGLQVFGHNAAARALYERTGYKPTSIIMSKYLDRRPL